MSLPQLKAAFTSAQISSLRTWITNVATNIFNSLPFPQATEAVLGGGKIATTGDVITGSSDILLMTPLKTEYGYVKKISQDSVGEGDDIVELNALNGVCLFNQPIPAASIVVYRMNNSLISDADWLIVCLKSQSNEQGYPCLLSYYMDSGSTFFVLENRHPTDATNRQLEVHFQEAKIN